MVWDTEAPGGNPHKHGVTARWTCKISFCETYTLCWPAVAHVTTRKQNKNSRRKFHCSHYHCYIDVGEGKVVHDKVRCNFYCHAGNCKSVLPKPGILEDVGQADEGHILVHNWGGKKINDYFFLRFKTILYLTEVLDGVSCWEQLLSNSPSCDGGRSWGPVAGSRWLSCLDLSPSSRVQPCWIIPMMSDSAVSGIREGNKLRKGLGNAI